MRRILFAVSLLIFACLITATPAVAQPHAFGQQLSAAQCDPGQNKLVLNIVFQVSNDADSGVGGHYWAIDSYMKHVQVWDMGDGFFCAQVKYNGSFVTVDGKSPSGVGHVDAGVTGTMEGGYNATFFGTWAPGTKRTKGNIGSQNYACIITAGVPSCNYPTTSWVDDYFDSVTGFTQNFWGWTYRAGDNGTWVNSSTGNTGDITGNP
jgi:hypothetical protein